VRESATYRREEARVLRGIDSCRDIFHVAHASFALCAFACHVRRVPIPHKSRSGAHFRYPRHAPIDGTHLPCHDFKCAYIRATTLYFLFRSFKLLFTILQLMGGPRLSSLHYYTLKSRQNFAGLGRRERQRERERERSLSTSGAYFLNIFTTLRLLCNSGNRVGKCDAGGGRRGERRRNAQINKQCERERVGGGEVDVTLQHVTTNVRISRKEIAIPGTRVFSPRRRRLQ
jgi:hypothetical protein